MAADKTELFILYQMGVSEEYTWFSVVGVFFSEAKLQSYAKERGLVTELVTITPSASNQVLLSEPREFVVVRSWEGEVPEVSLAEQS
jgi:hypothetical protein